MTIVIFEYLRKCEHAYVKIDKYVSIRDLPRATVEKNTTTARVNLDKVNFNLNDDVKNKVGPD